MPPRVFGPQKGADPASVRLLEERLSLLAGSCPRNPAGGPSGGLWAHFGAELVSGADAVLDAAKFDEHVESADAVVVGEGRLDSQTGEGKIISAILERVQKSGRRIPVVAVVGSVAEDLGVTTRQETGHQLISSCAPLWQAGAPARLHRSPAASAGWVR